MTIILTKVLFYKKFSLKNFQKSFSFSNSFERENWNLFYLLALYSLINESFPKIFFLLRLVFSSSSSYFRFFDIFHIFALFPFLWVFVFFVFFFFLYKGSVWLSILKLKLTHTEGTWNIFVKSIWQHLLRYYANFMCQLCANKLYEHFSGFIL